jgi:hypothetical protein
MAIYNNTYTTKEKITSSKLNQMYANEVNSADNIHPQYGAGPSYYSKVLRSATTGNNTIGRLVEYGNNADFSIVTNSIAQDINSVQGRVGGFRFKFDANNLIYTPIANVNFAFSLLRTAGYVANAYAKCSVAKNGTSLLNSSDSPVSTGGWSSFTRSVALATPVDGDVIDVDFTLVLYGANLELISKDISIYLS